MNEPEFQNIPSVQRNRRKTALCFHAKDDHPRVRDQVFDVLPELNCKVQAAIRRKSSLAQIARYLRQGGQRLDADRVYDELVSRIFRDNLHKPSEVRITFARRGKSDRQSALRRAVERGRNNFLKKWNISSDTPVVIDSAYPSESAGLQIVDYYLWALQRLFERYEDAHFNRVSDQYSLVMDLDDKRQKPYGAWYSKRDPLPLKKLKPVTD